MKRFTLLGLFILLLRTFTVTNAQVIPVRIMPLGDSNTEGYPHMQGGYRPELWTRLSQAGLKIEFVGSMTDEFDWAQPNHEGHSGWTISDLDTQVTTWVTFYQPEVVLLMIGTNDILIGAYDGMIDRFNLLIDHIYTAKPDAKLIVAQLLPIGDPTLDAQVKTFNTQLTEMVSSRALSGQRIGIIDMHTPFTYNDLIDGVHLTQEAFNRMGDVWDDIAYKLLTDPFQQLAPILNEVVHTPLHQFVWSQGTVDEQYKLKIKGIDEEYKFVQRDIVPAVCINGICRVTLNFSENPLPNKAQLKWKISGNGRKTSWQNFSTVIPGAPILYQPGNNTQIATFTPDFVWSYVPEAETYTLIVDQINLPSPDETLRIVDYTFTSASAPSINDICDPGGGLCAVNLSALSIALPSVGDYRWRVKTQSQYGKSRSFKYFFTVISGLIPLPEAQNSLKSRPNP